MIVIVIVFDFKYHYKMSNLVEDAHQKFPDSVIQFRNIQNRDRHLVLAFEKLNQKI